MILGDASSLSSGRSLLQLPSCLRPVVWEVAFPTTKSFALPPRSLLANAKYPRLSVAVEGSRAHCNALALDVAP